MEGGKSFFFACKKQVLQKGHLLLSASQREGGTSMLKFEFCNGEELSDSNARLMSGE